MFSIRTSILFFALCLFVSAIGQTNSAQVEANLLEAEKLMADGKKNEAARIYNQSAYFYSVNNQAAKAAEYYEIVLQINEELGNAKGVSLTHNKLSQLYLELEEYKRALKHLNFEYQHATKTANLKDQISVLINMAAASSSLNRHKQAMEDIDLAISKAQELNNLTLLKQCYGTAFDIYENKGDNDKAYEFFELYSAVDRKIKDQKMAEIESSAQKQVSQAQKERAKTQKELAEKSEELQEKNVELEKTVTTLQEVEQLTREQQMALELKEAKEKELESIIKIEKLRKRYWAIGASVLLGFVLVLIILLIKLRTANIKINTQRAKLERQNKEIRSSIRYAKTIQNAILPDQDGIDNCFENFIIYLPKDIVSGDFYWFAQSANDENTVFFAVVDCTGHGVPGAFMSMIGSRILNELVLEKKLDSPAVILEELNNSIRKSLRQEQTDNNDGMDMGLCKFQKQGGNYQLTYAGAKRPLYIVRDGEHTIESVKGDRKSIGGYQPGKRVIKFTDHQFELGKGDTVYLFSDGITDQNDPNRKKYGRLRLEDKILEGQGLAMDKQERLLKDDLYSFMSNEEQRDDIALAGLKLK